MYRYPKVSITFVVIIKELFWFKIRKEQYIDRQHILRDARPTT